MCQSAAKDASGVLSTLEPELESFLTFEKVSTAEATLLISQYKEAEADLLNWTPGTAGQDIVELLTDVDSALNALPLPQSDLFLANVFFAAVTGVIGVIEAHEPASTGTTAQPNAQGLHAAAIASTASSKVQSLVPEFKLSHFHTVGHQVSKVWQGRVTKMAAIDEKYSVLLKK
jgi:hypothetical protein